MGIGASIFLIAIGAILTWAVKNPESGNVNVHVVGVILMVVGLIGAFLSILFWESWAGFGRRGRGPYPYSETRAVAPRRHWGWTRRRTYVEDVPASPYDAPPPPG